jgi:hypothetical protein
LKSIGIAIDIAVLGIFPGIIGTVVLSIVCTLASSHFITSVPIGTFGSYVSHFFVALSEAITGNVNIANSGSTGGLVGGIAVGIYIIYYAKAANNLCVIEFEHLYALGSIGAFTGVITARVDEAIGNALLTKFNVGIPVGGAALGAFSGLLGGALMVIAKVPVEILTETAVTKVGGLVVTITAVIGEFIGCILIGTYFSSSMIFVGLLGIAFSVISVVILITVRQTRDIHIPLNDIITNFGEAIPSSSDKGNAANNWVQYKINLSSET